MPEVNSNQFATCTIDLTACWAISILQSPKSPANHQHHGCPNCPEAFLYLRLHFLPFSTSLPLQSSNMSRSSVAVAVVFFLISVALARTPSTLYENEVTVQDTLPDSGVKSILRLPSDTVNDDSHSYPDTDVPPRDNPESEPSSVRSVPLTMIRFHDLRPINRHIPLSLRSRFPFRLCRHHHDHPFFKRVRKHAETPYGDDMILSTVVVERDLDPVMRPFPEKWVSLPYHHLHQHDDDEEEEDGISKFVLTHSHRFGKQKLKKHLYHRHRDDEEEEEEENEENEEKRVKEERNKLEKGNQEESGFVKRIRKFLDHF